MPDDDAPVREAVAALRVAGIAAAPIGDEFGRWEIGCFTFNDAALLAGREPRAGRGVFARARAEATFASRRAAAPGHPPAHVRCARGGAGDRDGDL